MAGMREMGDPVTISFRIDRKDLERAERIAEKVGMPRARVLRNAVGAGLDDFEMLDLVGLLALVRKIEQWRKKREQQEASGLISGGELA